MRRRTLLTLTGQAATGLAIHATTGVGQTDTTARWLEDSLVYGLPSPVGEGSPTRVQQAVAASQSDFETGDYDQLLRTLPDRLALAAHTGGEAAQRALATLYGVATRTATKLGRDDLVAVTADRALTHALATDAPVLHARARRMVALARRRHGQYDRALDIAVRAADDLHADRTTPPAERLSELGSLYAMAAYTAARAGDRDLATDLLTSARTTATRASTQPGTRGGFLPRDASLYEVSVRQRLGDPAGAIAAAHTVDTRTLVPERAARLAIDVARSHADWGRPADCYQALLAAERAAPQEVRREVVQDLTRELLRHNISGAGQFARRTGAAG